MKGLILGLLILLLSGVSAVGQETLPPSGPFEEILQQLKFDKPTRIVGRFRSVDGYEDAIWVDWTHRHDGTRWLPVRNEMMFKLLPRDARMMEFFRALKPGISVHMTVQQDQDGNRHILELEGA
jgi:hypothetical protein